MTHISLFYIYLFLLVVNIIVPTAHTMQTIEDSPSRTHEYRISMTASAGGFNISLSRREKTSVEEFLTIHELHLKKNKLEHKHYADDELISP